MACFFLARQLKCYLLKEAFLRSHTPLDSQVVLFIVQPLSGRVKTGLLSTLFITMTLVPRAVPGT